jgi:hypothetical protein
MNHYMVQYITEWRMFLSSRSYSTQANRRILKDFNSPGIMVSQPRKKWGERIGGSIKIEICDLATRKIEANMSSNKDILTKEIESWAGFEYALREENRILFHKMLK